MEKHVGGCLCYGPPIEDGFYYDTYLEDQVVDAESYKCLESLSKKVSQVLVLGLLGRGTHAVREGTGVCVCESAGGLTRSCLPSPTLATNVIGRPSKKSSLSSDS